MTASKIYANVPQYTYQEYVKKFKYPILTSEESWNIFWEIRQIDNTYQVMDNSYIKTIDELRQDFKQLILDKVFKEN